MILKFWDRTQVVVSKAQWDNIKRLREQGKTWIELKNPTLEFDPKTIAQVLPGGMTEADVYKPNDPGKRLKADNRTESEQYKAARNAADIARKRLEKLRNKEVQR